MTAKPRGYEAVPFRMFIPAAPRPVHEILKSGPIPDEIGILGIAGRPSQFQAAKLHAEERLRRCRHRHKLGDRTAVLDLVRDHPELVLMDSWLRETLIKGKLLRDRRGRRPSNHPLVVVGLISELREAGTVTSTDQGLRHLEDLGFGNYDALKRAFYQTRSDSRFQAVLREYPERARLLSVDEGEELLSRTKYLGPGAAITYVGTDPNLGEVTLTFKAAS
jgi:hypothetical protein